MLRRKVSATFVLVLACIPGAAATAHAQEQTPSTPAAASATSATNATGATDAAPDSSDDKQGALKAFQEGQRAYGAGDYRHAAESFELAYKLKPHPSALWNAARARQRAGDIAKAANLFARYLRDAPPTSKDRNTAQTALRQLSPKLGQLEIHAVGLDDIRVDREPVDQTTLYVNPGAHVVEAKSGDKNVQQAQSVEAGAVESVALVAPADTTPTTPTTPPTPKPEDGSTATSTNSEHHGWSPAVVVVGGILTAVAGGVTIAFGLITTNKANTWDQNKISNPSANTIALRNDGSAAEVRTNIALGATVGLAALTGATALWLVDWKGRDRHVQVGVGGSQMMLRGAF